MATRKPTKKSPAQKTTKKAPTKKSLKKGSPLTKAGPATEPVAHRRQHIFHALVRDLAAFKGDPSAITLDASAPLVVQIHAMVAPLLRPWRVTVPKQLDEDAQATLLEVNALLAANKVPPLELEELTALTLLMRGEAFRWLAPYWSSDVAHVALKQNIFIW